MHFYIFKIQNIKDKIIISFILVQKAKEIDTTTCLSLLGYALLPTRFAIGACPAGFRALVFKSLSARFESCYAFPLLAYSASADFCTPADLSTVNACHTEFFVPFIRERKVHLLINVTSPFVKKSPLLLPCFLPPSLSGLLFAPVLRIAFPAPRFGHFSLLPNLVCEDIVYLTN